MAGHRAQIRFQPAGFARSPEPFHGFSRPQIGKTPCLAACPRMFNLAVHRHPTLENNVEHEVGGHGRGNPRHCTPPPPMRDRRIESSPGQNRGLWNKAGVRWSLVKRPLPPLGCLPWRCSEISGYYISLNVCSLTLGVVFLSPTTSFYIHSSNETLTPRLAIFGILSKLVLPATLRRYRDASHLPSTTEDVALTEQKLKLVSRPPAGPASRTRCRPAPATCSGTRQQLSGQQRQVSGP